MKIDGGASYLLANQQVNRAAHTETKAPAFDALLTEEVARSAPASSSLRETVEIERRDFTSMNRQELRDWMNDQLRSGEMTVEESQAFLGWTVDVRIDTNGRAISHDGDYTTRFNFLELASGNRDFYLQRGDLDMAQRIQDALDRMERFSRST
ncbi:hypothetical protein [Alkalilimnicola ehrlichii]|nr:hypothetical protein [Alkalilimnicola ehrlichii]